MPARVLPGSNTISRRMLSLAGMRCRPVFNQSWYYTSPEGAADYSPGQPSLGEATLGWPPPNRKANPGPSSSTASTSSAIPHSRCSDWIALLHTPKFTVDAFGQPNSLAERPGFQAASFLMLARYLRQFSSPMYLASSRSSVSVKSTIIRPSTTEEKSLSTLKLSSVAFSFR